jgi:hypothetical protein
MILLSFSIIGGHVGVTCCFKNSERNEFCFRNRFFVHTWFLCWKFQWNLLNFMFSCGTCHLLIYGCFHLNFSCKYLISCNNLFHLFSKTPCYNFQDHEWIKNGVGNSWVSLLNIRDKLILKNQTQKHSFSHSRFKKKIKFSKFFNELFEPLIYSLGNWSFFSYSSFESLHLKPLSMSKKLIFCFNVYNPPI